MTKRNCLIRGKEIIYEEYSNEIIIKASDCESFKEIDFKGFVFTETKNSKLPSYVQISLKNNGWIIYRKTQEKTTRKTSHKIGRILKQDDTWFINFNFLIIKMNKELGEQEISDVFSKHKIRIVRKLKFANNLYEAELEINEDLFSSLDNIISSEEKLDYAEPRLLTIYKGRS